MVDGVLGTKEVNHLREAYIQAFTDRYGLAPHLEDSTDGIFQWARKSFGYAKSKELINHYLTMNDTWFVEQAHSLFALRKNVNKVLASLGKITRCSGRSDKMQLAVSLTCDKCFMEFEFRGTASDLTTPNAPCLCNNCLNKP